MKKSIRSFTSILKQTRRNFRQTWATQLMTLATVSLSVLMFTFFFLIYTNMLKVGQTLQDDIQLTVYFDEEISEAVLQQYEKKIRAFHEPEKIIYLSRAAAFEKLTKQLGEEKDILADLDPSFLPVSIEIYPQKDLSSLSKIGEFSNYLSKTLPGAQKIQYGQEWLERFSAFTKLLRVITILSAILLILTTTFMIGYTIRLTVFTRQKELEILRLLGASNGYIKAPLMLEGIIQGAAGTVTGLGFLYLLFKWILYRFGGPGFLALFHFDFFPLYFQAAIFMISIVLCAGGSLVSIRKFLRI